MVGWKPSQFIFVHIPKCAGTSIEYALVPFVTSGKALIDLDDSLRDRHFLPGGSRRQHSKLRDYAKHHELSHFFKFAFVRNPWDRAISQILFTQRCNNAFFANRNFKENIRAYCRISRYVGRHDFGACQLDYLLNESGGMGVNYVGRFESLGADFEKACAAIGIKPAPRLSHKYDGMRHSHYSTYYDEESAEWIGKRFAKDINYFGYKFENHLR